MSKGNTNPDDYVIGIDIGGTNFRIGTITPDHTLENARRVSSRQLFETNDPILVLSSFLSSYMKEFPERTCRGICLGFPGTVDKKKQVVYSCPNLPSITNKNVAGILGEQFQLPVCAEHDVILLLANDLKTAKLQGYDCVIALYVGTGLGNALYIHGRFLDGKNGVAGELGHIPVMGITDPCPCGNEGCLELFCGGKKLEQIREEYYPKVPFSELFSHYSKDGPLAVYLDAVAVAAATEINILDPDCILLSGGVINMADFPYEQLITRIRHYARKPYPEQSLIFSRGIIDPFSGVLGAGIYMWDRIE